MNCNQASRMTTLACMAGNFTTIAEMEKLCSTGRINSSYPSEGAPYVYRPPNIDRNTGFVMLGISPPSYSTNPLILKLKQTLSATDEQKFVSFRSATLMTSTTEEEDVMISNDIDPNTNNFVAELKYIDETCDDPRFREATRRFFTPTKSWNNYFMYKGGWYFYIVVNAAITLIFEAFTLELVETLDYPARGIFGTPDALYVRHKKQAYVY